jgi:UDP-N-acetylmuramate dehydrogenase
MMNLSFIIHHLSFIIYHSSFIIHHSLNFPLKPTCIKTMLKNNLIVENYSLKPHNTFGIEARCGLFAQISSVEGARAIIKRHNPLKLPLHILGSGSNILFTKDYYGALVIQNYIRKIEIIKRDADSVWLLVGGGVLWHDLVLWTLNRGLSGLENLSLIPGTVGAAPIQNIGAYGVELADMILNVEAMNLETLSIQHFTKEECAFGYRDSVFKNHLKGQYMITKVMIQLSRNPAIHIEYGDIRTTLAHMNIDPSEATPTEVSNAICSIRKSKLPDPVVIGNAGSFFKNPVISNKKFEIVRNEHPLMPHYAVGAAETKIPAAWLIEQCGWKGKQVGNTGCHARQPLVLVNHGGATGQEIIKHAENVQRSVLDRFDIELVQEVNVW